MEQWQIDNAAYIYGFFTSRGFTPESTCGMLGNMMMESGVCSWRIQNASPAYGTYNDYQRSLLQAGNCSAYGLVQWGKYSLLINWCNQHGLPYWTVESQCAYLYYQMTNPVGMWGFDDGACLASWEGAGNVWQYDMSKEGFITSRRNPGFLAVVFCSNFERPAASTAHVQERFEWANDFYSRFALRSSASIPPSSPRPAPTPVDNPPSSYSGSYYPPASPDGRYQIQPGNTLSGIAEHFGVTVQDLCQWNGISDPNTIYAWHYIYVKPHNPSPAPAGGKKIVITIASGDTLWGIAQEYGVTVQELCQWNGIKDPNYIRAGASLTIYLPSSSPSPNYIVYTVQPGDTLWGIAQRYGVTVQDLCEWNRNLISDPNDIYPRERLIIYTGGSSPSGPTGWYTVRKGDTLWGIAQMYGVTVQELCEWNRGVILDPNKIYPNTTIRV